VLSKKPCGDVYSFSAQFIRSFTMQRKTAQDFDHDLLILFDAYVHGRIDRRGFLDRAQKFAVNGLTALGLLAALSPDFAMGQVVAKDDARLKTDMLDYASPNGSGTMKGYLARPASAAGKLPGILVVHENRGLNPHIEDIARRLALDGYMAFAPDALTPLGGYPGTEDKAREMFPILDQTKTREDFVNAASYLMNRADCTGKIGAVGFCYGGGISHMLAVRVPELLAAVPFYGPHPPAADAAKVKAQIMMHFAAEDGFVNPGRPAYEAALKSAGVRYTAHEYAGTLHGFNNDTTPRFDAAAAKLAWDRTLGLFNQVLKA
jgi:carboxymethylenebutenolidase